MNSIRELVEGLKQGLILDWGKVEVLALTMAAQILEKEGYEIRSKNGQVFAQAITLH